MIKYVLGLSSKFAADEDGATAIEYALIATFIGVGIVGSLELIPPALAAVFGSVSAAL